eukprot:12845973-Ditylum_brightwellii.AAC.1
MLTGQHLMVLLGQAQLVSGSTWPFLTKVESNKEYVPHLWPSSIRRFLCDTSVTIQVHQAWLPKLPQEHDLMLMDVSKTAKTGT